MKSDWTVDELLADLWGYNAQALARALDAQNAWRAAPDWTETRVALLEEKLKLGYFQRHRPGPQWALENCQTRERLPSALEERKRQRKDRRLRGLKSALGLNKEREMTCGKSTLFHVAAILHPTDAEHKTGARAKVVLQPQVVVAESEKQANTIAVRAITSLTDEEAGRVEVFVSPF